MAQRAVGGDIIPIMGNKVKVIDKEKVKVAARESISLNLRKT
jgi:hypothetical protein